MVDFQSRDTRRGVEDEGGAEPAESADDESAEAVAVLATSGAGTDAQAAAADALAEAGYSVRSRDRSAADHDAIQALVNEFVDRAAVRTVVTVGGTGVRPDDHTVEAVRPLVSKALPAVGEAFRREWAATSGAAVLDSRVFGAIVEDTPVFCLPGDREAAAFAARELLAPEAAQIQRAAAAGR